MNNSAMTIHIQAFVWTCFQFSRYMPRSRISEQHGNSIFSILKNYYTVFHNALTNLHFHQQCVKVPISPHLHQKLFIFLFKKNLAILVWIYISLRLFLIYITLMTTDIKCLFMGLLATSIPPLEMQLFNCFLH